MSRESFRLGVIEHLQYYVYRLIDPRDGQTFYIGKGKGNRIFSHIYDEQISQDSNAISDKIQRIREIKASGLEVLHVIHRHALDEKTAFEVEGALIDAYLGLANIQNGSGNSENGVMHVYEINQKYAAIEAIFEHKVLLISINKGIKNNSIYDAVRFAWRVNKDRAEKAEVILAVSQGIIRGAYINAIWLKATAESFPMHVIQESDFNRFGFIADEAPDDIKALYIGKKIPKDYERKKGDISPIKYTY
ncbi:hypothetical protein F892_03548 [Acinetobacter vivianii]|uniref:GIY-YIG domain-containing protein n=1 Tax=Acinetobacter vivianii TaxID=1776742 RepID=N9PYT4_9GAMM|nr:hypothetical protein [Acinetobacter vivianii]ENX19380.1 hypothetical protein F892_03548 [Acinetobacter vivianii]